MDNPAEDFGDGFDEALGEKFASLTLGPPQRRLVTIRRIAHLEPIKESRSEVATVDGWHVIVTKQQYHVGELIVYFEIDCFLPWSDHFWEYAASTAGQNYDGQLGYVVRTTMKHGHISQGLILPLHDFPEINIELREELMGTYKNKIAQTEKVLMELDYAELLGIKKFEQRFQEDELAIHGCAPIFFPQPGCDRVQNVVNLFANYSQEEFLVTEKLDGIPITIYHVDTDSQWYSALPRDRDSQNVHRPQYGICGRHVDYVEDRDVPLWKFVRKQRIIEKMPQLASHCSTMNRKVGGNSFAIQGEFCGHFLCGNSMGFQPGEHHFYAFGIYDIDNQKWLPQKAALDICERLGIDHVPIVIRTRLKDWAKTVRELLARAKGIGLLGKTREGLIFRAVDSSFSFKAISNSWLLEWGEFKNSHDQW